MRLSKENLSRLHKAFKDTREFKLRKGNKHNLNRLLTINECYLVALFNDNRIELSYQYGDEQLEEIYHDCTINQIIECIKLDNLTRVSNIYSSR